jgi:NADP-reducing hydrogenase subunit HndC
MDGITKGKGKEGDIEELETLAGDIKATALCGLGQTAPNPVLSTIRYFRNEYEAHIKEKRCPSGACKSLIRYSIEAEKCRKCGICAKQCGVNAIKGDKATPYEIDNFTCIKCGACIKACPFGAVTKG